MNEEQPSEERIEKITFDKVRDLNEVEHVLIGSSTPDKLNFRLLNEQLAEGKLDQKVLAPSGITFPISIEEAELLERRREDQEELSGTSFAFLDILDQLAISQKGYRIRFQPIGPVNEKTGVVQPIWRISIDNPNAREGEERIVNDIELDKLLRLNEFYEQYFILSPALKTGARYLHPKALKERTI